MVSTDASGGGLDLEAVYNAATPISRELSVNSGVQVETEAEDAPLIPN